MEADRLVTVIQCEVFFDLTHRTLVMKRAIAVGQVTTCRPWAADVSAANAADGSGFDQFEPILHTSIRCFPAQESAVVTCSNLGNHSPSRNRPLVVIRPEWESTKPLRARKRKRWIDS